VELHGNKENEMKSRLPGTVAALALTASTILTAATPASAAPWGWRGGGWWPAAAAIGIAGGAVAAATSPLWAPGYYGYPGYASGYGYGYAPYSGLYDYATAPAVAAGPVVAQNGRDAGYCEQRFRSYDPASGTYLGFDGLRHPCP
jgi:hypothetical protein